MEPAEYANIYRQEESFWWYRGLHRLAEECLQEAWQEAASRRARSSGAPARGGNDGSGTGRPRVLDAGCGTGGMLARLSTWADASGIDFSPLPLGYARRRGPFPLARASVVRLPFRADAFDLILSLDVLYHRAVESDLEALREFRRCLRPGGTVVLNLPAFESLRSSHDVAIHTARRYRRAGVRRLLVEAGLEPVRVTHWNSILFPGLAAVRRLRRRARDGAGAGTSDVRPLAGPLNACLEGVLAVERLWLRAADLLFGLSLLAVARRPEEAR